MGGHRRLALESPRAGLSPRKGCRSGAFPGRIVAWNRLIVAQRVPNDGHSVRARLATWHAKITLLLPGTEGNHCKPRMTRGPDEAIGPRNTRTARWSCLPVPPTVLGDRAELIQPTKRTFTRVLHKRWLTPSTPGSFFDFFYLCTLREP